MARADKNDIMTKAFCDDVYTGLAGMRMQLLAMRDELELAYGEDSSPFREYQRHLMELADQIEWKLQILSHACPYDWKGSREQVESIVSVEQPAFAAGSSEFSGGYLGG